MSVHLVFLPMYDWPEIRMQTLKFWQDIRTIVHRAHPAFCLPAALSHVPYDKVAECWRHPDMMFSQTCWGPLSQGLDSHVSVLAQPDYSDYLGGRGAYYRSAIVSRSGVEVSVPHHSGATLSPELLNGKRFAYNDTSSLSGFMCLSEDLNLSVDELCSNAVRTYSHRASIRAVAAGKADIAAIDCRSWALARAHENTAQQLVVVGWTAERLGLPYITSHTTKRAVKTALSSALCEMGCLP